MRTRVLICLFSRALIGRGLRHILLYSPRARNSAKFQNGFCVRQCFRGRNLIRKSTKDDDTYGEHFFKKRYEAFADWVKKNLFNSKRDRLLSSRLPEF